MIRLRTSAAAGLAELAGASLRVPQVRLGSGTTDATTFLRGDAAWATIAGSSGTLSRYFNKPSGNITRTSSTLGAFSTAWQITGVVVASGQNVLCRIHASHNGSDVQDRLFGLLRGSTTIASWIHYGSNPLDNGPLSMEWIDENPGAGTYTYEVQGATFGGATLTVYQSTPTTDAAGGASIFIAEVYAP